jgi:hypothetical protein
LLDFRAWCVLDVFNQFFFSYQLKSPFGYIFNSQV